MGFSREDHSDSIVPIRKKWKGTMTDQERFLRQMYSQSVDRCFNIESGY